MQAQRYSQLSQGVAPIALAAALAVGGLGGYTLRAATVRVPTAEAASEVSTASKAVLVPRSLREDTPWVPSQLGPLPRSVREDDSSSAAQYLIPRSVREGAERGDGTR